MIPKIIHYCWFGNKNIPEPLQHYINGWKEKCPDWEIKLWNEENFDINSHPFTQSAYEQKKYAFVSDYVRAWALYEFGGVYLDTDVEIKLPIDNFLNYEAFSGFEGINLPFTAVWGSIPKHSFSKKILGYYHNKTYSNRVPPNTLFISDILVTDFHIDKKTDSYQIGSDNTNVIHIFPSNYFCLDLPINYTTHHFIGSWIEDHNNRKPYKQQLHNKYYSNRIESDFFWEKDQLKQIAKNINLTQLLIIVRYYIRSKFKKQ
ncbi:glycosyltransferase family 32 protein [Acinetobacter dispersus]|uniref:glycosyltransferase family 32 protein n=1 Tax=Acinetobacter dispersus TaxID=70348 RepID=UPI00132EEBB1|nr:glycosyltransferase [Acinetobacter dispersus]QHH99267.1 glycosyl transferase [Acinetobacter dispersus]